MFVWAQFLLEQDKIALVCRELNFLQTCFGIKFKRRHSTRNIRHDVFRRISLKSLKIDNFWRILTIFDDFENFQKIPLRFSTKVDDIRHLNYVDRRQSSSNNVILRRSTSIVVKRRRLTSFYVDDRRILSNFVIIRQN